MQIRKKLIQTGRRAFLRKSAVAGGAVVASGQVVATADEPVLPAAPEPAARGYSESEHVRAYYKRARF